MPTPMTHAVVGASFSTALPQRIRGFRAAIVLGLLAVMPDLDIVGFYLGVPYSNTFGHRGVSHSLPFALLIAAGLVALAIRFKVFPGDHALRTFLVTTAATGSHGLLDMTTDGGMGVGLLMPFVPDRVFFPFRPIEVSPISPRRFLTDGAPVLASEFIWIWIPIMVLVALVWIWGKHQALGPTGRGSDVGGAVPERANCRLVVSPTLNGSEAGPEEALHTPLNTSRAAPPTASVPVLKSLVLFAVADPDADHRTGEPTMMKPP